MKHDVNPKNEKQFNDQGAMNNNLDAATIQMNPDIAKQHIKPKVERPTTDKTDNTKML
ncbi:hypothetical protein [Bacillus sp. Cr_A10]|uniref:hypothetical protein n=1 Tax=Bacillus sp. Cr_A10 TaxID=3033993 RepID=UPI0023DA988B|nr:hypothetical protein [Bacillus sp. Cr_A10]MDF2065500.1 hypothetical protein [Bacillus sp. Cr_A10]